MTVDEIVQKLASGGYGLGLPIPRSPPVNGESPRQHAARVWPDVVAAYQQGIKVESILCEFRISRATLYTRLEEYGVPIRRGVR